MGPSHFALFIRCSEMFGKCSTCEENKKLLQNCGQKISREETADVMWPVVSFCEYGNELLGSIKACNLLSNCVTVYF
jgi:hypothetical protein